MPGSICHSTDETQAALRPAEYVTVSVRLHTLILPLSLIESQSDVEQRCTIETASNLFSLIVRFVLAGLSKTILLIELQVKADEYTCCI